MTTIDDAATLLQGIGVCEEDIRKLKCLKQK